MKLVPHAVAKMELMEVLLLGFKKMPPGIENTFDIFCSKNERKECHSMTVTAVVRVTSTFSSSLCGFSLRSPWV